MQHTLKAIRVLEYSYIPCAKYSRYLAVAVANLAAILDSRNYQEAVLHSLAGMGISFSNRHGVPEGQSLFEGTSCRLLSYRRTTWGVAQQRCGRTEAH